MSKPTLLILAAGMGSRYGGLKQLDEVGPKGETIIDYAILDAIATDFKKIVFVIRENFADEFRERIIDKYSEKIECRTVFQHINENFNGIDTVEREKPWGTGHAVLCAKDEIDGPFAMINADDFYGREAFKTMSEFLKEDCSENLYAMVAYKLGQTLSPNGTVSRGVCSITSGDVLSGIKEHHDIFAEGGKIKARDGDKETELPADTHVSMNMWGFHPNIFVHLKRRFRDFVEANRENPKAEFYIPTMVNELMTAGNVRVRVLVSDSRWYGITYKEDKTAVAAAIEELSRKGVYPG